MQQVIRNLVLAIVIVASSVHAAQASEAELREAYEAYQETAAAGDFTATIAHAQTNYEWAAGFLGTESPQLYPFSMTYAALLSRTGRFYDGVPVLAPQCGPDTVRSEFSDREWFDCRMTLARLFLGTRDYSSAVSILNGLQTSSEVLEYPAQWIVVLLHHALAIVMDRTSTERELRHSKSNHLEPLLLLLEGRDDLPYETAMAMIIEAEFDLRGGHWYRSNRKFQTAITALVNAGYAEFFTNRLARKWLMRRRMSRMEEEEFEPIREQLHQLSRRLPPLGIGLDYGIENRQAVPPEYPMLALQQHFEGSVTVEFSVDETGRTINIEIVDGPISGIFDRPAIRAIEQFVYEPLIVDGVPRSRGIMSMNLNFEMAE